MSEQLVEEKAHHIITLEDGTQANFGVRTKLLVSINELSNTVTFKLFTGRIIVWSVPYVDGLGGFVKAVYLYGLVAKIKSSIASNKDVNLLEETLVNVLASLDNGIMTLRNNTVCTLTSEQKAYAMIKSSPECLHYEEMYAHWYDISEVSVIEEIIKLWATFDRSRKNTIRKDAFFAKALATINIANMTNIDTI
jgi:hypothetical protein